jgi:hypothetical protein
MWFLPSALNVKVKKFKQARVNGGSNYDSKKPTVEKLENLTVKQEGRTVHETRGFLHHSIADN